MEITDRADLGADLFAPTTDGSGKPYWGYELITYVQPGDVILHWHKALAGEPAIVGWSRAAGAYEDTDISWQAHGTVGRSKGTLDLRRMPLVNYTSLSELVLISDVRAKEAELRKVLTELEAQYPGGSLYFPFGFSEKRELRAQQTYFVKMPREVLDVLSVGEVRDRSGPSLPASRGKTPKRRGSGYIADVAVRSAIEWRAVNLATADYEARGYTSARGTGVPQRWASHVGREVPRDLR